MTPASMHRSKLFPVLSGVSQETAAARVEVLQAQARAARVPVEAHARTVYVSGDGVLCLRWTAIAQRIADSGRYRVREVVAKADRVWLEFLEREEGASWSWAVRCESASCGFRESVSMDERSERPRNCRVCTGSALASEIPSSWRWLGDSDQTLARAFAAGALTATVDPDGESYDPTKDPMPTLRRRALVEGARAFCSPIFFGVAIEGELVPDEAPAPAPTNGSGNGHAPLYDRNERPEVSRVVPRDASMEEILDLPPGEGLPTFPPVRELDDVPTAPGPRGLRTPQPHDWPAVDRAVADQLEVELEPAPCPCTECRAEREANEDDVAEAELRETSARVEAGEACPSCFGALVDGRCLDEGCDVDDAAGWLAEQERAEEADEGEGKAGDSAPDDTEFETLNVPAGRKVRTLDSKGTTLGDLIRGATRTLQQATDEWEPSLRGDVWARGYTLRRSGGFGSGRMDIVQEDADGDRVEVVAAALTGAEARAWLDAHPVTDDEPAWKDEPALEGRDPRRDPFPGDRVEWGPLPEHRAKVDDLRERLVADGVKSHDVLYTDGAGVEFNCSLGSWRSRFGALRGAPTSGRVIAVTPGRGPIEEKPAPTPLARSESDRATVERAAAERPEAFEAARAKLGLTREEAIAAATLTAPADDWGATPVSPPPAPKPVYRPPTSDFAGKATRTAKKDMGPCCYPGPGCSGEIKSMDHYQVGKKDRRAHPPCVERERRTTEPQEATTT